MMHGWWGRRDATLYGPSLNTHSTARRASDSANLHQPRLMRLDRIAAGVDSGQISGQRTSDD
jgi:hypothetical protein